ncbi:MAG: chemotaxis protein CheB [Pseudomonadota bacterium]
MKTLLCKALVMGGSAGSLEVLLKLFGFLPRHFPVPVIAVCHLHPNDDGGLVSYFRRQVPVLVEEAGDKEAAKSGHIYFAPANYHLMVEPDKTFSLSVDPKVNFSRPSIDVLFDSAATVWAHELLGIILTGASSDGAAGIVSIKRYGGMTIAQDPKEAAYSAMPQAAIDTGSVDEILTVDEIGSVLQQIARNSETRT